MKKTVGFPFKIHREFSNRLDYLFTGNMFILGFSSTDSINYLNVFVLFHL